MGYLNQIVGSSGSGSGGERGPRGIAGRGIQSITTQDNNNGTINLTINYDDGSPSDTFVNSLVSDTLIQLEKLTLEGTNNTVKFSINQVDETVIYKCDTVAGINIMKSLLVGNGIKKLGLMNDEIIFIDNTGEHFKIFSETSGSITFKSLYGAGSKMLMKDLNDNEIFDISDTGVNYYPEVYYGKTTDIGGIKLAVRNVGITAQRDTSILNSNLIVNNNGIDIFKVRNDNSQTEVYKLFTRDIISDGLLNFLDGNELLVMKLDTDNRNLELNNTQFTMVSGENGITLLNEPLTGITSILKTKTDKIIIPDTVLNIVDTNETPIMQVKTDNNVNIFSQLNVKSSSSSGTYTDFAFTTLSNQDGTNYGFQCGTHFLISTTPLICTGVMDFMFQYKAQVTTTCVITGDMSVFNITIDPDGRFQFEFTAGVNGNFAFAFSPEMAVQIGMSSNPPNPSKIVNGGTGVGDLYMLFQTSGATAGSTYTFQSDGLFGNTIINNAIEITSTTINSTGGQILFNQTPKGINPPVNDDDFVIKLYVDDEINIVSNIAENALFLTQNKKHVNYIANVFMGIGNIPQTYGALTLSTFQINSVNLWSFFDNRFFTFISNGDLTDFSRDTDNQLLYTGLTNKKFHISFVCELAQSDATNETIRLVFFKNSAAPYFTLNPGVSTPPTIPNDYSTSDTVRFIPESYSTTYTLNQSQPSGITCIFTTTLSPNDYLNIAIDMYLSGGIRNMQIFSYGLTITEL